MLRGLRTLTLMMAGGVAGVAGDAVVLEMASASRYVALALKCADQEYPNKLDHVMASEAEVQGPRTLHPAFYGCFDWHSAVHGHWLMVRSLRAFPNLPESARIRALLEAHLAPEPLARELAYLGRGDARSFERPYGWAWLLKLSAELESWDHPDAKRWAAHLRPLAQAFARRMKEHLPRLSYPIRTGVHPNTAYALSLTLDYALAVKDQALETLVRERAIFFFGNDKAAPLSWEPGGEDFLSPSLEEAALMGRILPPKTFRPWLKAFLPRLGKGLKPASVSDRTDPKIVHLDGLNLSRARCLYRLAGFLGPKAPPYRALLDTAEAHAQASLPHIASGDYGGEHWLGTFAMHLLEAKAEITNRD